MEKNQNGVYTGYNRSSVVVFSSVVGGEITHAATGNPAGCNGVFFQEVGSGNKVHDIAITVNSQADADSMTCGVIMKRAINPQVYNCTISNNASAVENRHSVPAVGIIGNDSSGTATNLDFDDWSDN